MGRRVDFSRNAKIYDRRHGAILPESVARELSTAAKLEPDAAVLDVGAGTGRVSLALGRIGYTVVALDPSPPMLQELRAKAGVPLHVVNAAGSQLPFNDDGFDAVILSRVLYLIPDWHDVLVEVDREQAVLPQREAYVPPRVLGPPLPYLPLVTRG